MRYDRIRHGWTVQDAAGERIGVVARIVGDHLLVEKGELLLRDAYVPMREIVALDEDEQRIRLAWTAEEIARLDWEDVPIATGALGPTELERLRLHERTATGPVRILVLGRDTCEDTVRSLALLRARGVPFDYRRVDMDPAADAWVRRLNGGEWRTPTILIGDDPERPEEILREPSDEELSAALQRSASYPR